jgi:acetyl-CoA carboxylase carboxyltransferase component
MAKRGAIHSMGRHKALGSSWRSMDSKAYSRSYEPETRPEFRCYVTGQAKAWQAEYDAKVAADARREAQMQALLDLKQRMLDKNLL